MNRYEMTVVYNPTMDEEALKAEHDVVLALLERFDCTVEKIDDWGKRRLAYEIQKLTEGVYRFITFRADVTSPAEIESRMRIRENILRYLIIRLEEEVKAEESEEEDSEPQPKEEAPEEKQPEGNPEENAPPKEEAGEEAPAQSENNEE